MNRTLYLLSAWCLLAAVCPFENHPVSAADGCPAYLWIACGDQTREKDGSVTQRYQILTNGGSWPDCRSDAGLHAVYTAAGRYSPAKGYHGMPVYRRVPVVCTGDEAYLDINARANTLIDLYVYGVCGGKRFMAQTNHPLYGRASSEIRPLEQPAATLPGDIPRLLLEPSRRRYHMQTGQTYRFTYTGGGRAVQSATIIEDQKPVEQIAVTPAGALEYTPAHDPDLDRSGAYDTKEAVVLVEEAGDGGGRFATTFTLLLHRSIYAHSRLSPGLALFAATAAAVLVLVLANKRRPWYR